MDAALQMGPHWGSVEGKETLPQPAGHLTCFFKLQILPGTCGT